MFGVVKGRPPDKGHVGAIKSDDPKVSPLNTSDLDSPPDTTGLEATIEEDVVGSSAF